VTVELRPLGVNCNIRCHYCYQNPQREAGNLGHAYDLGKMKAAVERVGGPFSLFGGEPLLLPKADLEGLWSWGLEKHGRNSLQTNGVLIDDVHIRLFKTYKVGVGISADGPGTCNDARWMGSLERTREATAKTHAAIDRLCAEGIPPSLIVTLHRGNATREKLPVMREWFKRLDRIGVRSARLHVLEVDAPHIRQQYTLSTEENVEAILSFLNLERQELKTLKFDLFRDMRNLLLGRDETVSCVWKACDPYTTRAVQGVEGSGQISNCGRTNKDGIDFVKADTEGFERYLVLYQTPQQDGGCKDCRFFLMCKGQCPGTAIDGDWRNRTEYCDVWKRLYEHLETSLSKEGLEPVSTRADRERLERFFIKSWRLGRNTSISQALRSVEVAPPPPTAAHRREVPEGERHEIPMNTQSGRSETICGAGGRNDNSSANTLCLGDFLRVLWVSDKARDVWEPRFVRIRKAWSEIEWLSVVRKVRPCAVTTADSEALVRRSAEWVGRGLTVLPFSMADAGDCPYQNIVRRPQPGKPCAFRVVLGTVENASAFLRAFTAHDDDHIGHLLGYPSCCRAFFRETWLTAGLTDTTWPMALGSATQRDGDRSVEVRGFWSLNMFWRWLGIRAVPHLPCSFACERSAEVAEELMNVARKEGYGTEIEWMKLILSWPVEWTALHGIAEIKTPLLKVATNTDVTSQRRMVSRRGDSYPIEGARGLAFLTSNARTYGG
jgi:uncharacterized protein